MCGLVGYAALTPPFDAERLVRMRDALRHRGPDDAGRYVDAGEGYAVGLGHRRLAVIDPRPHGRQPMVDARGETFLVFNGEIYGFQALRQRLEALGHAFATGTDTEVLLAAFAQWDVEVLSQLDGMFAFAIWHAPSRRLFLARDRLGIKPMFLAERGGALLFASEIKALLASDAIDDGIDLQAHHDYLDLTYTPGPRTMLRGVRHLPPGHALVWQAGRTQTWRYWQPSMVPKPSAPSFGEAAEQMREGLRAAVQRRLVADVPLGLFLSGGIDSTAVLWAMAERGPVQAFTIRFAEATYDESAVAARVAAHFGATHHIETVRPTPDEFIAPLTEMLDQPFADSSVIPLWYLARLARSRVTVALGGDGGDEVFAGYRTHLAWQLARGWRRLPAVIRQKLAPAVVSRLPVSHAKVAFDLKARAFIGAASLPEAAAHHAFKSFLSEAARHDLQARPVDIEPTVRLFERAFAAPEAGAGLDAVLACDQAMYLPDDILTKVDRATMAHGLEGRVPFLDHTLVEAANALPWHYKLRGLTTKAVLRRALRGRVPAEVLRRRKAGFNVPMAQWLLGPLRPLLDERLAEDRVRALGLWRPEAVAALRAEHAARKADHSRPLWALLCFMLFNDRFRGGRPA
ncbi:MAG: asparagine synthase (glutamine-hydrolyzing) [Myxococcales bacterium]|nr:asparagine synthase (glutamine-hydrolyzing) [Myxococcales bacterium]